MIRSDLTIQGNKVKQSFIAAIVCITTTVVITGGAWATFLIYGLLEQSRDVSETIYHIGSGIGGLSLAGLGLFAIFGAPNKYEKTALSVEREKISLQKNEFLRNARIEHALKTLEELEVTIGAIGRIRNPFCGVGELRELAELLEEESKYRDPDRHIKHYTGLITALRSQREKKIISKFFDLKPKFLALFHEESCFTEVSIVLADIHRATEILLDQSELEEQVARAQAVGIENGVSEQNLKQYLINSPRTDNLPMIWQGYPPSDRVGERLTTISAQLREFCKKVSQE